ncbi:DUF2267 domain-containing protein [Streptomyces lancefieldiae]|uniref:DUF2267 domain-containing protein n=1 Tax=Streptomyces lancefieldiae TaxID=3075520 RepID=A0ABU3ALN1_9ACTN|nr:DUF2267 domain-containing protein [Streptomyces sp. DSM 40712]MDT0611104.1 DUF2267 domain-containing protein [Streptomyces sp. DSM 40712]
MQHDEMIGKVQALTQLPGRGPAEQATRAVLTTLAERLPSGLADHMAAQLSPQLAASIREVTDSATAGSSKPSAERFDLTAFAGRIAARTGTDEDAALREAAGVLEVLDAALTPELMENVSGALPADIRELVPSARATEGGA